MENPEVIVKLVLAPSPLNVLVLNAPVPTPVIILTSIFAELSGASSKIKVVPTISYASANCVTPSITTVTYDLLGGLTVKLKLEFAPLPTNVLTVASVDGAVDLNASVPKNLISILVPTGGYH